VGLGLVGWFLQSLCVWLGWGWVAFVFMFLVGGLGGMY